jgi:hypothetical protein
MVAYLKLETRQKVAPLRYEMLSPHSGVRGLD